MLHLWLWGPFFSKCIMASSAHVPSSLRSLRMLKEMTPSGIGNFCLLSWPARMVASTGGISTLYPDLYTNLQYLQSTRHLNPRQAQWAFFFSRFNFDIYLSAWLKKIGCTNALFRYRHCWLWVPYWTGSHCSCQLYSSHHLSSVFMYPTW